MVSMYGKNAMRRRLFEVQNLRLLLGDELKRGVTEGLERCISEELEEIDTEIECLMEDVRRA